MLILRNTGTLYLVSIIIFLLTPGTLNAQNITLLSSNDTVSTKIDSTQTITSLEDKLINPSDSTLSATDSLKVIYFNGSIENLKLNRFNYIDTNTYHYQQFDPLHIKNRLYSTLSNIGMASKNLVYSPTLSTGYYLGSSAFTKYLYHNKDVKYYSPIVPYTELRYVMASKKEQNFNVIFTREIFKGFTIGIDYALNYQPSKNSLYQRSGINDQRAFFTTQYYTKNKRYGIIANYLRNKIVVEENGGIKYDSIFEDNLESDRRVIPVNLMKAENMVKQTEFFVEQYFNILPPKRQNDSVKRKIDPGNISYSFRYRRNQMIYTDNDTLTPFYIGHNTPLDNVSTYDSLYQSEFQNTLRWSNIGYHENPKDKIFYMYLGASHNIIKQMLPHDSVASNLTQLIPFGGIAFNFGRSFNLNVDVNYVFGNYNQDDYTVDAILSQYLGNEERNIGSLKFGLNLTNKTPNWYYNNYQSNYYRWSNNLKKERYLILTGSYSYKQFSVGAKFYTIDNYTYLNDSVRPAQIDKGETLLQLFAEGTIPMNKFGINTRIVYQTTSQPNIIRVPSISGVMDIYLRSPIFKKAAVLQTGFQVTYFSEYYADAYMPALRLFYLQNTKKIGNYPYLDYYITLMVKRARIFFKVAHFNSYFGDYRYYLAPNYPARDSRFCFGVSWRFHD